METLYNCRRDCCPEMFYDGDKNGVLIKDDFGGSVFLTRPQFEALRDAYEARFKEDNGDA